MDKRYSTIFNHIGSCVLRKQVSLYPYNLYVISNTLMEFIDHHLRLCLWAELCPERASLCTSLASMSKLYWRGMNSKILEFSWSSTRSIGGVLEFCWSDTRYTQVQTKNTCIYPDKWSLTSQRNTRFCMRAWEIVEMCESHSECVRVESPECSTDTLKHRWHGQAKSHT